MPKNNEVRETKVFSRRHMTSSYVENYFVGSSLPNLKAYFGRVKMGQPEIYDTPFAKGESTQELLEGWNEVLVSIKTAWPTLYEFEEDMASKVGPLSVMAPLRERMDSIMDYYSGILLPHKPISESAIAAVIKEWEPARGIWLRGEGQTVEQMKKSTNSGSPYFTKRRNVVDKTVPFKIYNRNVFTPMQELPAFRGWTCAVLGWRGQEGGPTKEDVKQRVVWMFPFAVNVAELQVYQPLIEAAQKFDIVPAWVSMESVDKHITKLFDTKGSDDLVICTDFTKFDQHFNFSLAETAGKCISRIFNRSVERWLEGVFPIKYTIPLAIGMNSSDKLILCRGEHGMGSGSGGTNADETLAHRAMQYEVAQLHGAKLNLNSMCLGDDGILTYPGCTVKDVVDAYSSHGLELNTSKQYASTQDCVYLRRWHHKDYRIDGVCAGVYSTMRALGRLRYLERYMDPEYWGPEAVALRQLSILENVKYHPLRDQFAQYCMKRDKYRLGIDIPGFLDHLEDKVRGAIDHMPDFMGYTKTLQSEGDPTYGINSWWIVNYLKSNA